VCLYGGQIVKHADTKPRCPTQMHFGDRDASIPMSDVEIIKQKRGADCDIYVYAGAQHGFCCDERESFNAESAAIAWARAIRFLDKAMGK
jgi:carboxymethylenebutenolidase